MVKVAFVCVHNSCRSQIAEALGKIILGDVAEVYSAGTHIKDKINPDAVRIMKKIYGIDMQLNQKSKLLAQIPTVDYLITMGCNVDCPVLPSQFHEDWGLDDPSGQNDLVFEDTIKKIFNKLIELRALLTSK